MENKDEKEIINLYFNAMFTYKDLIEHFKGKYCYAEFKQVILDYYKKMEKNKNNYQK